MSHVTKCDLQIKDLGALAKAAEAIGMKLVEGQKTFKWFGQHVGDYPLPTGFTKEDMGHCDHALVVVGANKNTYSAGVVRNRDGTPGYSLMFDFWAGGHGLMETLGQNANHMRSSYAEAVAMSKLRAMGRRVSRTVTSSGKVVLRATRLLIAFSPLLFLASCSSDAPPQFQEQTAQAITAAGWKVAGAIITAAIIRGCLNK